MQSLIDKSSSTFPFDRSWSIDSHTLTKFWSVSAERDKFVSVYGQLQTRGHKYKLTMLGEICLIPWLGRLKYKINISKAVFLSCEKYSPHPLCLMFQSVQYPFRISLKDTVNNKHKICITKPNYACSLLCLDCQHNSWFSNVIPISVL